MKVSYAPHADVLYIVFEETANACAYVELESGIICRVDDVTDRVVGITVPFLRRRADRHEEIKIPELNLGLSAEGLLHAYGKEGIKPCPPKPQSL